MIYVVIIFLATVPTFFITRYIYLRLAEQRINAYFDETVVRHSNEVENIYMQMRGWKHDYHSHIQVLKAHLSLGETDKIEGYLDGLESDLNEVDSIFRTGNVMIDAILTAKLSLARAKNIEVNAKAIVPPVLPIAPVDMCIIVGNLLDNAIEACELLEKGAFVRVYLGVHKEMFYISVQNSDGGKKKKSSTGQGLFRIDKIAEKYGGNVNRQNEPGVFATEIMLPI
ncbi:MAG: GHKL domain-containing protein [Defluviitaleaceae bacterium]|nr:GHKL domain-containing protein [Defluviitaleaceae bacterium]MCL2240427.1 GHKL domain-containing protein [Defluviitaleaceae bacterium]